MYVLYIKIVLHREISVHCLYLERQLPPYWFLFSVIREWFKEVRSGFTKMFEWTYLTMMCSTKKTSMYVADITAESSLS